MKLASCATLKDEQVGIINIADYILYQLNKNDRFDYVNLMCLKEPSDDIIDMLTSSAIAQNKFKTVNRRIVGNSEDVPDVMFAAEKFVKAFRASELGKLILDIDMISWNWWIIKIFFDNFIRSLWNKVVISQILKKKIKTANRWIVGVNTKVPDVMYDAEKIVKAFRASELGKLILDVDVVMISWKLTDT